MKPTKPEKFRICDESETEPEPLKLGPSLRAIVDVGDTAIVKEEVVILSPSAEKGGQDLFRLDLPDNDSKTLRSHEPELDTLLDSPAVTPVLTEDEWETNSKRSLSIPPGWLVLFVMVFAASLIWGLVLWKKGDTHAVRFQQAVENLSEKEKAAQKEASHIIDSIDVTVREYFQCTSVDDLARLVRYPDRVTPLMRDHYKNQQVFIGTVTSFAFMHPLNIDHRTNFWAVAAVLSNGHKPLVTVEVTPSGKALIDWESLVCYQPMAWTEYAQKRPMGTTMDFRVYAEPVDFNSHEFKDAKEWLCVRLTAYESDEFLYGYAKIESDVGSKLRTLIRSNQLKQSTFTLRLSLPADPQSPRGVVIDEVLFPGWIPLDSPWTNSPMPSVPDSSH